MRERTKEERFHKLVRYLRKRDEETTAVSEAVLDAATCPACRESHGTGGIPVHCTNPDGCRCVWVEKPAESDSAFHQERRRRKEALGEGRSREGVRRDPRDAQVVSRN